MNTVCTITSIFARVFIAIAVVIAIVIVIVIGDLIDIDLSNQRFFFCCCASFAYDTIIFSVASS